MATDPAGQPAVTDYRVLGRSGELTWLELKPRTGRMHQLRVHCASLGCPVLGDAVYGRRDSGTPLHLHARAVALAALSKARTGRRHGAGAGAYARGARGVRLHRRLTRAGQRKALRIR